MSACCSTYGNVAGAHFDEKIAKRDLESYRKKGPGTTARLLRDLLVGTGAVKGVLLDVGSGVGGLSFELLDRGAERVIAVDASPAYLAAAAQEATRRDRLGVVEFIHGDFVDVGPQIPSATIVTLDRVICCYPSFEPLLNEALRHVEHAFAYSYPRDLWYVHSAIGVENAVRRLKGNPFRAFVHPVDRMTQTIERVGFHLAGRRQTWQWSADVWER
jgi:magnesium-protoporphyrin O-methyltransferase